MSIANRGFVRGLAATLVFSGMALADEVRELTWDDLIPGAETTEPPADPEKPAEEAPVGHDGSEEDTGEDLYLYQPSAAGVVEELDGVLVKLPGFIVPLEVSMEGKVSEFLLVPYFGACIHFPPPPSNQIVYVTVKEPIDLASTWDPIWATGEIETEFRESDLAYSGYTMAAREIEVYEY